MKDSGSIISPRVNVGVAKKQSYKNSNDSYSSLNQIIKTRSLDELFKKYNYKILAKIEIRDEEVAYVKAMDPFCRILMVIVEKKEIISTEAITLIPKEKKLSASLCNLLCDISGMQGAGLIVENSQSIFVIKRSEKDLAEINQNCYHNPYPENSSLIAYPIISLAKMENNNKFNSPISITYGRLYNKITEIHTQDLLKHQEKMVLMMKNMSKFIDIRDALLGKFSKNTRMLNEILTYYQENPKELKDKEEKVKNEKSITNFCANNENKNNLLKITSNTLNILNNLDNISKSFFQQLNLLEKSFLPQQKPPARKFKKRED